MEKTHHLPLSVMIKERRLRWLGHAARRSDNNMVKQLIFATTCWTALWHLGALCYEGCEGHGSANGNWPKEAMNRPIWAGIVDGAKLF